MHYKHIIYILILGLCSCVPTSELKYLQYSKNLDLTKKGYIKLQQEDYFIQSGDIINVVLSARDQELLQLFNSSTLGGNSSISENMIYLNGLSVKDDGLIELPLLGNIKVVNLTQPEIEKKVRDAFYKLYKKDALFVKVQLAGINYTMLGEIGSPGTRTRYRNKIDLFEAIASAGDLNITADRKRIVLLRQYPEGRRHYTLDITKEKIMNSPYFYLQPNDIIFVNPLPQKTLGFGTNLSGTITTISTLLTSLVTIYLLKDRF